MAEIYLQWPVPTQYAKGLLIKMISLKPTTSEREERMILAELKFKSATTTDKILDIPTNYYCEGQSNLHMICPTGYDM